MLALQKASKPSSRPAPFALAPTLVTSGVLSFILWATYILRLPDMAYGESLTLPMLLILLGALAVSVLFTCLLARIFIFSAQISGPKVAALLVAVFLFSPVANDFIIKTINSRYLLATQMTSDKIEYFCAIKYEPRQCVNQISYCPQCVSVLNRKTRTAVATKLMAFKKSITPELDLPPLRAPTSISTKVTAESRTH